MKTHIQFKSRGKVTGSGYNVLQDGLVKIEPREGVPYFDPEKEYQVELKITQIK